MSAETKKDTATDPNKAARDMIERGAAAGREYAATVGAATIAGIRTAFELQNSFIAAGRSVADAAVAANAKLADKVVESVKAGQAEATKLADAGQKLAATPFDRS